MLPLTFLHRFSPGTANDWTQHLKNLT